MSKPWSRIQVRLPPGYKKKLENYADEHDLNLSTLVRGIIWDWISDLLEMNKEEKSELFEKFVKGKGK